ncbi:hypothetical protein MAR_035036 [Mya arenaria]|uniref:Uncharacterized protein n=1 Tax=Mya arenaria TaxID=6604 RepID=A0ABY7EJB3_MYAAR|nr:hypothetical protein MAR_035036 [Mya arenaria]
MEGWASETSDKAERITPLYYSPGAISTNPQKEVVEKDGESVGCFEESDSDAEMTSMLEEMQSLETVERRLQKIQEKEALRRKLEAKNGSKEKSDVDIDQLRQLPYLKSAVSKQIKKLKKKNTSSDVISLNRRNSRIVLLLMRRGLLQMFGFVPFFKKINGTHSLVFKGKMRIAQHICATCWIKDKKKLEHPECSTICPHSSFA